MRQEVVLATVLVVAALTALPARLGSRRPMAETLFETQPLVATTGAVATRDASSFSSP